jgi:hypothetical protein
MTTTSYSTLAPQHTQGNETRNGLGVASLVLGIVGFVPFPGVRASVLAIVLGWISGTQNADGSRRRSAAATTGVVLRIVGVALFAAHCFTYFVVLGYPLPAIHRYQPPR